MLINAYWIAISSELWYSVFTAVSLFFNTIFCLFVLTQINFLFQRLLPKRAFSPQELSIMYIMMCMVSTISGFFYLLSKAEKVFASSVGWHNLYLNERSVSAWISLGLLAIFSSRKHLARILKQILLGNKAGGKANDSTEPMRYRTAIILALTGFLFIVLFCYYAGMSLWAIALFFFVYIAMAFGITRVRAAFGPPYHEVVFVNPRQFMTVVLGSRVIGGANLTIMSFLYPFTRCDCFARLATLTRYPTNWNRSK